MMKSLHVRRPSASMVVAIIALVIAASSSAIAATALQNGDKLIKKHSLSGNRLRNDTLTGTQIKETSLGKVPSAGQADSATNAANANHAASADQATNATNANHAATADQSTDAGHATTADSATHANSADTARSAGLASDANSLGGLPSPFYQRKCTPGAIAAYAYIKGSSSFSSTYTSAAPPVLEGFNCTGGVIEVKRTAAGTYDVHFGGLDDGGELVAVGNQSVTPLGVAVNGGEVTFKLVFDASVTATVYQVKLDDTAASAVDNEFSFALLSPR